jgi:D-inositol-3-phosphate glycosyltransferase
MRIAMLSIHSSPVGPLGRRDTGGMSVVVRELAAEMGRRGHRVDVFTGGAVSRTGVSDLAPNVRLVRLHADTHPAVRDPAFSAAMDDGFRALDAFRAAENLRYDVVHSHYWISGEVGRRAQLHWGAPHLVTFHTLGALKARVSAVGEPDLRLESERRRIQDSDGILVPTGSEGEALVRHDGAAASKIYRVPYGVDLENFRPRDRKEARKRLGEEAAGRLLLFVGRFDEMKGLDRLLASLPRLSGDPAVRLLVVGGDGERSPETRRWGKLAAGLGVGDRTRFVGRMAPESLPWYYSAADAVVMPSRYESFGLVALEALACGTPVAATSVGVMAALIDGRQNGRLAPNGSPSAIADTVRRVLEAVPPMGGPPARQTVLAFTWRRAGDRLLAAYRQASLSGARTATQG